MDLDGKIQKRIAEGEAKRLVNIELREKYRRVLRRTLNGFDSDGGQSIVYENDIMIDKFEKELVNHVMDMDKRNKELKKIVKKMDDKINKFDISSIQERTEVLNQQIRILEVTMKYIKN